MIAAFINLHGIFGSLVGPSALYRDWPIQDLGKHWL